MRGSRPRAARWPTASSPAPAYEALAAARDNSAASAWPCRRGFAMRNGVMMTRLIVGIADRPARRCRRGAGVCAESRYDRRGAAAEAPDAVRHAVRRRAGTAPAVEQPQQPRQTQQPATAPQQAAPSLPPPPKPKVEKAAGRHPSGGVRRFAGDRSQQGAGAVLRRGPQPRRHQPGRSQFGLRAERLISTGTRRSTEQIAADSFDLAVVMIGINDRQEITVNGQTYKSLTEAWKRPTRRASRSFLAKLRAARKPVIWVGLPPMAKAEYSAAISQISKIQRLASFSGGAEFLEIYERFPRRRRQVLLLWARTSTARMPACARMTASISRRRVPTSWRSISASRSALSIAAAAVSVAVADPLPGTDAAGHAAAALPGAGPDPAARSGGRGDPDQPRAGARRATC